MAILIVYVDDIILSRDDLEELVRLKGFLAQDFAIKDLGQLRYFLGMEVARTKKGISISQKKCIVDLLKETCMLGCKPSKTPIKWNDKLRMKASNPIDRERYQRLVGKLIYLAHTRLDIAFAVSLVSQYMHDLFQEHLNVVYKILRYLKTTPRKGIFIGKNEKRDVEAYVDVDWAGSIDDRKSTIGYCTFVWGTITWRSKKQNVMAQSSTKAEYRALTQGTCELIRLQRLLEELKIPSEKPIKLFCNNKVGISIAYNPVHHDRTKHVEVDKHFIKEKIENGVICMTYVPTTQQIGDILTKGLSDKVLKIW